MLPVTEQGNALTQDLDLSSPEEIVRLLRQVDAQLFAGFAGMVGVNDTLIQDEVLAVARAIRRVRQHDDGVVVFTGCGTSGRVALWAARTLNQSTGSSAFKYLLSGGDQAMALSVELPEDDPDLGMRELVDLVAESQHVLLIGITCGLSAPYVAGQVAWAMQQPHVSACVIGFNPASLARNAPVERWNRTCRDVFLALEEQAMQERAAHASSSVETPRRHFVLNPVVGPEAITGSSRMKGGSMTLILACAVAFLAVDSSCTLASRQDVCDVVDAFEATARSAYRHVDSMARLMRRAGNALARRDVGHIYYLGAGNGGVWGMIDASEMVDTYGAGLDEVRAFVAGGWTSVGIRSGDISPQHALLRSSTDHFASDLLDKLDQHDLVVVLTLCDAASSHIGVLADLVADVAATRAGLALVAVEQADALNRLRDRFPDILDKHVISVPIPAMPSVDDVLPPLQRGAFALKLIVNGVTTGAQALRGVVWRNRMINVGVSNNKLYHRSIAMIAECVHVDAATAEHALLRSIHDTDDVTDALRTQSIEQHLLVSVDRPFVVPTAMLLAAAAFSSVAHARAAVAGNVGVRSVLASAST